MTEISRISQLARVARELSFTSIRWSSCTSRPTGSASSFFKPACVLRDVDAQDTLKIVGRGLFIWAGMSCLIRVRVVCVQVLKPLRNLLRPENLIVLLVMHRIITIKKELLKYKLASEDKCPFCLNPDSTEHSFIYCEESNEFFSKTLGWFNEYYTENVRTKIANFPGAWHENIMHLSVPTTFKQTNFI